MGALERTAVRCGGRGGGDEHLGATREGVGIDEFLEAKSVERRKVENAVRSFPRIAVVGEVSAAGFKGLTNEGLPFNGGF